MLLKYLCKRLCLRFYVVGLIIVLNTILVVFYISDVDWLKGWDDKSAKQGHGITGKCYDCYL